MGLKIAPEYTAPESRGSVVVVRIILPPGVAGPVTSPVTVTVIGEKFWPLEATLARVVISIVVDEISRATPDIPIKEREELPT